MPTVTTDPATLVLQAVLSTIESHDLLPRQELPLTNEGEGGRRPGLPGEALAKSGEGDAVPVIVGTSGGPDSVALLHILWRLSTEYRVRACTLADGPPLIIAPIAAHLNHALRGREADEDQRFVESLAVRLGVPFETARVDVAAEAAAQGLGTEEAARLARRRFLADVAGRRGARLVALGHHADDRAETVLFNILRGTGIEGLASLGPKSTLESDIQIVRPMIAVTRDQILAYLGSEGLEYRHDATNSSREFTRNRLRADLLPLLGREFNPRVDESLVRLSDQAAAAGEVLADALDQAWRAIVQAPGIAGGPTAFVIDADDFSALRPWLQGAILRRAVERLGGGLKYMSADRTREVVSALLAKSVAGPIDLPDGLVATRRRRAIRIEKGNAEIKA
jgi:tRNA(Ile)-lysidine synthase